MNTPGHHPVPGPSKRPQPHHQPIRRAGFTVVELLAVVAIVAVLASLATLGYGRMVSHSRGAACAANLRAIGAGLNLYLAENRQQLPVMVAARESVDDDEPALDTVLADYVDSPDVFRCPGDNRGLHQHTGTSYHWNSTLNGQHISRLNFLGLTRSATGIPLAADKENFHPRRGDEVNILYADGRVEQQLRFVVDNDR